MKAKLIAVGERAPGWVAEGFGEYRKRLSHWLPLDQVEVEPGLRGKGRDAVRAMQDEGARVLAAIPKNAHVVVLDGRGKAHSSEQLAQRLEHWRGQGRDLALLVGTDGKPIEVSVEKSSGHRVLDREAQRHVQRTWTFRPAMRDGQAVQAVGIVPIDFNLDRG